ncbi:MAG: hypothetical protein HY690_10445 [Chloroflexi bacterium]|nr:hypothetical protein [Chloroflexota bacterium]
MARKAPAIRAASASNVPRGQDAPTALKGKKAPATRTKVTLTIPTEVLETAVSLVQAGCARSLSAYVSEALAEKVASDQGRDEYLEWLKALNEELGQPGEAAYARAREALGL